MSGKLVLGCLLVGASFARAEDLVAVLPLDAGNAKVETADRELLEEGLRNAAWSELKPFGYTVLTAATTLRVLADNGVDPSRACEASCALDAARELKAKLFLSGSIVTSEGVHVANIRLFDAATGSILTTLELEGPTVRSLREKFKAEAKSFFTRGLGPRARTQGTAVAEGSIGPKGGEFEVGGEDVVVKFDTTPPGAVVLVDGRLLCPATPCSKVVSPGVHEVSLQKVGFDALVTKEKFAKGVLVTRSLLSATATVDVRTMPPGLPVRVDDDAPAPAPLARTLAPGSHALVIDDPCWEQAGERVSLAKGDRRVIEIAGQARVSAIKVSSEDARGNAIEAEVFVDGEPVGEAPGTLKVPLCAKKIEVRKGDFGWRGELSLREREVFDVAAKLARLTPEPPPKGNLTLTLDATGMQRIGHRVTLENGRNVETCTLGKGPVACQFPDLVPGRWRLTLNGDGFEARTAVDLMGNGTLKLSGALPESIGKYIGLGLSLAVFSLLGVGGERAVELGEADLLATLLMLAGGAGIISEFVVISNTADQPEGVSLEVESTGGASLPWGHLKELDAWSVSLGYWHKMFVGARADRQLFRYMSAGVLVGYPGLGLSLTLHPTRRQNGMFLSLGATAPFLATSDAISKLRLAAAFGTQAYLGAGLSLRFAMALGADLSIPTFIAGPDAELLYQF